MRQFFGILRPYTNLVVALSEKSDASMRFEGKQHRDRFLENVGVDALGVVSAELVHGNSVQIVSGQDTGNIIPQADGLITIDRGVSLSVTVADCLAIFLFDPQKEVIGLFHAGWRGLASNIVTAGVEKMQERFRVRPQDILAGVGPGIGPCHYEVQEDVIQQFQNFPSAIVEREGKIFLNLKRVAVSQLKHSGIKEQHIEVHPDCTYCVQHKYFSYRRDKTEIPSVMMALIKMK